MKENHLVKHVDAHYATEETLMTPIEVSTAEDTLLNPRDLNKKVMKPKDDGNILINPSDEVMKPDDVYAADDIPGNSVDPVDKVLKFKLISCPVSFRLN